MYKINHKRIKIHCLHIYRFIVQIAKEAQNEIAAIEAEFESNTIMNKLTLSLEFSNKIIEQLSNYTQNIENDMKLWKVNSTQTMKATPAKKGKFSLRKEKNPEFVEDEFLEISKINMTEELNVSQPSVNKKHDVPNDECNSTIDMSSDNSNAIDYLINEDINDIEEQEILNNITSDSSIFDSDSDHSIFSCDTVILSDKENKSKNIKHGSKSASASVKVKENKDRITAGDLQFKQCYVNLSNCKKTTK